MRVGRSMIIAIAGLCVAAFLLSPGQIAAPIAGAQPGFYRLRLGDYAITALNDGVVGYYTAQLLPTAGSDEITRRLSAMALTDPVPMSYNAFLVDTGHRLVLIDAGTGGKLQESPFFRGAGRLAANLIAAGYRPDQVDEIYITHLGPDHVGGLATVGGRAFPNAIVRLAQRELDRFLLADTARPRNAVVQFWSEVFTPYIDAGKLVPFESDTVLAPGIRALATHGHSEGHTSYVVESRGQALIVWGDLVLVSAVQMARPELESSFDVDRQAAVRQRLRMLALAAERDYWVAGAHLPFPGVGHVRSGGDGYSWVPATYTIPGHDAGTASSRRPSGR